MHELYTQQTFNDDLILILAFAFVDSSCKSFFWKHSSSWPFL